MTHDARFVWRFTLREALLLGFCATFIVLTRAALRLHLGLPGHSMFFLVFFLLVARGCVPKLGAATLVATIAGLVCLLLGMAKLGPVIVANFVLPAVVVDAACALRPRLVTSIVACLIVGGLASATKGVSAVVIDWLTDMEAELVVQHAIVAAAWSVAFGVAGAAFVAPVVRRLQANGLAPSPARAAATAASPSSGGDSLAS
jgi:hypothetical protein